MVDVLDKYRTMCSMSTAGSWFPIIRWDIVRDDDTYEFGTIICFLNAVLWRMYHGTVIKMLSLLCDAAQD